MLRIFAKHGTNEKVLMMVPPGEAINFVMSRLNNQFGGDWVYVDALKVNEFIRFTDNMVYLGYHPKFTRYSNAIFELKTPEILPDLI
jgi:hypothetical protein